MSHKQLKYIEEIVALLPGHVYWKNVSGEYLGCNDLQAKALGLDSRSEIVNVVPYSRLTPEEAESLIENDKRVIDHGEIITKEEHGIREDGSCGVFLTTKKPILDERNKVIGLLGVSLDITEKKKAELKVQEVMIERSNLMASLANDLRSLFQAIYGVVDLKRKGIGPAEFNEILEMIYLSLKEKEEALAHASDFSRLAGGQIHLLTCPFQLNDFLYKTMGSLVRRSGTKADIYFDCLEGNIDFKIENDTRSLANIIEFLLGDLFHSDMFEWVKIKLLQKNDNEVEIEFDQRLKNIKLKDEKEKAISNQAGIFNDAVKTSYVNAFLEAMSGYYTRSVGINNVCIVITLPVIGMTRVVANDLTPSELNCLVLGDNKIMFECLSSMLPDISFLGEAERKLFDDKIDFILLDEEEYKKASNKELICKEGCPTFLMVSSDNKNFHEQKESYSSHLLILEKPIIPFIIQNKIREYFSKKQVLFVDDDAIIRKISKASLEYLGVVVTAKPSGEEAIEFLHENIDSVDAIAMDIGLRGISGVEATQIIRSTYKEKCPPIVAVTGYVMNEDYDTLLDSNLFDAIIEKPADFSRLAKLINSLCEEVD